MHWKRSGILLLVSAFLTLPVSAATFPNNRPSTTNNDDSCDIALLPAATLLLPFFEVDVAAPVSVARTTIFTVVNTARQPQIARVTIWTDLGFPVMWFNTFLTGYDVQAFNVYDLIARGVIAPPNGTSNASTPGSRSAANGANPNFLANVAEACGPNGIPVQIPPSIINDVKSALTVGTYTLCGTAKVGGAHTNAVGYITVDVMATCSVKSPHEAGYYAELLYDNVLTGDYEIISPNPATGNYAGGNPLVHIRAIPEGGPAGVAAETSLPYTFYDRLTPRAARAMDRRQPLPSTFTARFIQGGPSAFNTDLHIWREATNGPDAACSTYNSANRTQMADVVRFDERENPTTWAPPIFFDPQISKPPPTPVTGRYSTADSMWPVLTGPEIAGWLYLNLNNGGSTNYSAITGRDFKSNSSTTVGPRQSQNWVTVSMFAEGRYSVMMDATMLANGCTPSPATGTTIAPGPDNTP